MGVGAGDGEGCAFVRIMNSQFDQVVGDAPVVGNVSMDQIAIDLTDFPSTGVGCGVELISADPDSRANCRCGGCCSTRNYQQDFIEGSSSVSISCSADRNTAFK